MEDVIAEVKIDSDIKSEQLNQIFKVIGIYNL